MTPLTRQIENSDSPSGMPDDGRDCGKVVGRDARAFTLIGDFGLHGQRPK